MLKTSIKAFVFMELGAIPVLLLGQNFTVSNYAKITAFSLFLSLILNFISYNQSPK